MIHPGVYDNENVEVVATDDYEPIGWFGQGEIPFDAQLMFETILDTAGTNLRCPLQMKL